MVEFSFDLYINVYKFRFYNFHKFTQNALLSLEKKENKTQTKNTTLNKF